MVSLLSACAQQQIAPEPPRVEAPPPAPVPAPAPAPVSDGMDRVALLVPLSGNAAGAGQALLNASQMAMFDVAGEDFVLQPYDTRGTTQGATEAMRKALSEGAQLVLGPLFSSNVAAVRPIAEAAGVNVVSFSTDTSVAGGNVYVMGLLLTEQAEALARYARQQGLNRLALLAPSSQYGQAMAEAVRTVAARAGLDIGQAEFYAPGAQPDDAIKRLAGGNFQALILPESGQQLRAVAALLPYHGIRPERVQYMGTLLWAGDDGLGREPSLVGAVFPAPSPQSNDYFNRRYAEAFGQTPPAIARTGYDGTALAAVLAKRQDQAPFDARALTNPQGFVGVDGLFRLRTDGTVERGFAIMRVTERGTEIVVPAPDSFTDLAGS